MPDRPGKGLASRFRASIDARLVREQTQAEERRIRQQRAAEARAALLVDLEKFGREVGHFDVDSSDDGVALRFGDRVLRFEVDGPADGVVVSGDGIEGQARIFLHETLDRWVLATRRGGGAEDQRLLFEAGLEQVVAQALGVEPLAIGDDRAESESGGAAVKADKSRRTL